MSESSMPWVKLYTEIIHDAKLRRLTDAQKWRFVQLICLAGRLDADGAITNGNGSYTLEDIAWELHVDTDEMAADLESLQSAGLVFFDGSTYIVTNFEKRQGRSQSEKRQVWRKNKADYRAKSEEEVEECPIGHQSDTNESPTYREEKRREEKSIHTLSANADTPAIDEPKKRAPKPPTEKQIAERQLAEHFQQVTRINLPSEKSKSDYQASQVRWWKPIRQILEQTHYDMERATFCVDHAIQSMRKDRLTISAPQSILNNALSVYQSQEAL